MVWSHHRAAHKVCDPHRHVWRKAWHLRPVVHRVCDLRRHVWRRALGNRPDRHMVLPPHCAAHKVCDRCLRVWRKACDPQRLGGVLGLRPGPRLRHPKDRTRCAGHHLPQPARVLAHRQACRRAARRPAFLPVQRVAHRRAFLPVRFARGLVCAHCVRGGPYQAHLRSGP